jgi:hypothetical protein
LNLMHWPMAWPSFVISIFCFNPAFITVNKSPSRTF